MPAAEPHAKKRFGQNFLHDAGVIARIVKAIAPQRGDALIEIGPGAGALTVPLLQRVDELHVVELDRELIPYLQRRCGADPRLIIHQADALRLDYAALSARRPLRLAGNLPYNISTPLLFHLLRYAGEIADMHFMLQKEVVARMCAAPGSEDYGRLTVTLAAHAECTALFDVGPGAFRPAPKVHSSLVRVRPRPAPFPLPDPERYQRLVTAAFGQRRKTLANALRGLLDAARIEAAGIDPGVRAERLPPAAFARLALAWGQAQTEGAR